MLTPEAQHRVNTIRQMAAAAVNKDPMQPEAVRFLQKCPNDVVWLCNRIDKLSKGEADVENESLREDHEALRDVLLSVCSQLDVEKIDDIIPAIVTLKLKTSEPDEIETTLTPIETETPDINWYE